MMSTAQVLCRPSNREMKRAESSNLLDRILKGKRRRLSEAAAFSCQEENVFGLISSQGRRHGNLSETVDSRDPVVVER